MLDELWDYSREGDPITFTGYRVYDDAAHRFVDAPEDDQRLIRDYPFWRDKGPLLDNTRLTLTTAKSDYSAGEPIRVAHLVEEAAPGRLLYVMGPKAVRDEFVDGVLVTDATPAPGDYPWLPMSYDGEVVPSPGIDWNFVITEYRFRQTGIHRIQWCPGRYRSNVLEIEVADAP